VLRQAVKRGQSALSWKYPIYHGGFRLWEVAQSLRGADLSLFLSREDLDYAVETLHVQPNRAHVVDNGIANSFVGLPFFPETAPGLRIAVVGAYSHRKINVLPTAINRLLPQKKKWKLGFFGTLVDDAEVRKDYADCIQSQISIMLFPSLSEGLPVSVFEAMACGLALVASALPTLTTRLTNGQEAIFFPPGDPEAIAGALTNIEQNSDKLLSIREAGYKRAQEFSWARVARTTAKLYEEAVHAKRAEARLWTV
jgi:glycosyltransferase involved in cell wall biosynthesis